MAEYSLGVLLFTSCFLRIYASHHWVVTENGKIQPQMENSGFPLARPDDLLAFLEQEKRVLAVSRLYKQLMSLKKSIDIQWSEIEKGGDVEERLYSSHLDCLRGEIPLSQHNLNTEFLDYEQGSRPKMKNNLQEIEPDCTAYSELDFSMRTFPHLETLNKRKNLNLTVSPVPSKTNFNFNIDAMLKRNASDWAAYNVASLYWRMMGNGSNAIECARRALYFSPRDKRYIALLNLGTLLQELQSLGEAAIILHSAVDHDPIQHISHLALGNVYAALGDYKRSLACYENVLSLNSENSRALRLKHALLCHEKLESGLLEMHFSLQNILQDLQKHNKMDEEWLNLQNQVNWERDSRVREFFSIKQPIHLNLQMLLQNVEHQAKTLNEEVSRRVPRKRRDNPEISKQSHSECRSENDFDCLTYREKESEEGKKEKEFSTFHQHHEDSQEVEESSLENFDSNDYSLKNKLNSLITFVKSNYEKEISLLDYNKKNSEKSNVLKEINRESFLSIDPPFSLNEIDACIKDSNDMKKLN